MIGEETAVKDASAPATDATQAVKDASAPATDVQNPEVGQSGSPEAANEGTSASPQETESNKAEKRIQQLVARQREAEREAAYWKGVAEASARQQKPVEEDISKKEPKVDDFENYDDYLIAKAVHVMESKLPAASKPVSVDQQLNQRFVEKIEAVASHDPAIHDIVNDPTLPINPNMAMIIKASDIPDKLLRHLNNNREEALKIFKMNPIDAARQMMRLEVRLESAPNPSPPKTVSSAPEPVKTVIPNTTVTTNLDEIPMDEFMKRRNKTDRGKK